MAFIGTPLDTRNTFQSLQGKRFNGDGSTTAFTLDVAPSSTLDIEVFVGNVRQDPNSAYTLSGTTLTFTGAPPSGTNNIYVVHQAKAVGTIDLPEGALVDLNGGSDKLVLDADGDTTISADTDDQIDIKIAGADDFQFTANTFTAQSGSTIAGQAITATTVVGSGAAQFATAGVGAAKDLGTGIHIRTADSGGAVEANADELVVEGSGNSGISILSGTSSVGAIHINDSGGNERGAFKYDHGGDTMRFHANGAERMRIQSDGDISIGATANSARLDTQYDANAVGFQIQNQKSSGCNSSTKVAVIQGDQDSSGSYDLVHIRNGGGHVCNIADNGNIQNSGNSYGALSDERIKQDIADASSQWNDIKALKIRKYKLKKLVNRDGADNTPYHLGVVAQELEASSMNGLVEENNPEKEDVALSSDFGTVVDGTADNGATPIEDADGNITGYKDVFTAGKKVKAVKYSVLYMKAIKALQEAMAKIESLEARVTTLEG